MVCKVLVVDDSTFFQVRLKEIVDSHPDLMVVGVANNGQEAIAMAKELKPDVISMDYEMPYMDGISAVRAIMAENPIPIIMFSSLTYEGARITFEALEAGAVDFLPKNFADISHHSGKLRRKLQDSLLFYARETQAKAAGLRLAAAGSVVPLPEQPAPSLGEDSAESASDVGRGKSPTKKLRDRIRLLIIGASTGGPVAVTDVLMKLPKDFAVPIVVVQHMPANFTKVFAERLNRQCQLEVREAKNGDILQAGVVFLAPGAQQLIFDRDNKGRVRLMAGDERVNYNPSVDVTFASASRVFAEHVLAVVLTGMGNDGCHGARMLKETGATVWAQDQRSCVVYGMPKVVASAGLADEVMSLTDVGERLRKEFG